VAAAGCAIAALFDEFAAAVRVRTPPMIPTIATAAMTAAIVHLVFPDMTKRSSRCGAF